eukprot:m.28947 g.28947  ORF g.28947 m.28947 type:complete len:1040 (+) comp4562_c0_seq1:52-3171(+)
MPTRSNQAFTALVATAATFVAIHASPISHTTINLDGADWNFATDTQPADPNAPMPPAWVGRRAHATDGAAHHHTDSHNVAQRRGTTHHGHQHADQIDMDATLPPGEQGGSITVPGCWSSPTSTMLTPSVAYGNETDTRRFHYVGLGWYHRTVTLPASCAGQPTLYIDAGMHRRARTFVRPMSHSHTTHTHTHDTAWQLLFDHTGYLDSAEAVIPTAVAHNPGGFELAVGIDASVHASVDPLMGAEDIDTDGTNLGGWGGLNSHVTIECRPPVWIAGVPHVTHAPVTTANHGGPVTVSIAVNVTGAEASSGATVTVTIVDSQGKVGGQGTTAHPVTVPAVVKVNCTVANAMLWDPETPTLYWAQVAVSTESSHDNTTVQFGIRSITTDGYKFRVNGRPLFLTGYGDDSVYPLTVAPPRTVQGYVAKLQFAKDHRYRFVRHHSTTLPDEYFEAADAVGIMISPELPCAYKQYYDLAGPTGRDEYARTWAAYIARLRNHPCVFDWAMCNEYHTGIVQGPALYSTAKALDPTRLVIDCDGVFGWSPNNSEYLRPTLDFWSVQFDVKSLPLTHPDKFQFEGIPTRPVISHETGNYNTFPRVQQLITDFEQANSAIKPYWLTPAFDRLNASGLLHENEQWSLNSEQLYRVCWKSNIEALRKNPLIYGYEWWLIQDYWGGDNGLSDTFLKPKSISEDIASFHANVVLLEDGLHESYISAESLNVQLSLSNFGLHEIEAGSTLAWSLVNGTTTLHSGQMKLVTTVPQGAVEAIGNITWTLPNVGTTRDGFSTPTSLSVVATLSNGSSTSVLTNNSWTTVLYPAFADGPSPDNWELTVSDPSLFPACMFNDCVLCPGDAPMSNLTQHRVHLTTTFEDRYLDIANAGGVVVLVPNGTDCFYPIDRVSYKQAWWVGNNVDNNAGTVVYDSALDTLGLGRGMAPGGWADWTWWRLIEGAQTFILDDFGPDDRANTVVDVRAIDIVTLARNKALLMQLAVGKGLVLGVGLNVLQPCDRTPSGGAACPMAEKAWVLDRVLRYAGSQLDRLHGK